MKRLIILVVLVALAGIAGIVARSHSRSESKETASQNAQNTNQVIRETYELAPGATVELAGLNGSVNIETSDTKSAQVLIERTASSQEALDRRPINIEATANSLRIRTEKHSNGFWSRVFGSDNASEKVSLKLPRHVSLLTKGINGPVTVGELEGSVEAAGINGRVEIASASGMANFKGVNGNILVALKRLGQGGITLSGVNGNIELRLPADANADLEAKGMNGRVISDLPNVTVDNSKHGNYSARIGNGGNAISAKGINGNIRLTRGVEAGAAEAAAGTTSKE